MALGIPGNSSFDELLTNARLGDESAVGTLLQNHRNYLLLIANQEVLRLHSFQQIPFDQIGESMSRSPDACQKLWTRAVMKLQEIMAKNQFIE